MNVAETIGGVVGKRHGEGYNWANMCPMACELRVDTRVARVTNSKDTTVLFGRHNKGNRRPPHLRGDADAGEREFYTIDYDMMVKGSIYKRRHGLVRQFGVTVNGSTRLVTSGDTVDRATYRALVQAGALRTSDEERARTSGRAPDARPGSHDAHANLAHEDDLDEAP